MTDAPRSTLFLLRHAHSSWAVPGQRDHQRPLDHRGRDEAVAVGLAIRALREAIDAVVCSTATRAEETFAAIRPHLRPGVPARSSDALYALGIDAYLAEAHAHDRCRGLLLVGHNPMIEELTLALAGSGDREALSALSEGYPTAGLAVLDFATDLAGIGAGRGHLRSLSRPGAG